MALRLPILFVLPLLLMASVAMAAPSETQMNEAKKRYRQGEALYEASKYAEAIKEFETAYSLSKRPAILYNIGRAYIRLGDDEAAIRYLQRYLDEDPDSPDAVAVRNEIAARKQAIAAAEARRTAEAATQVARKREAEAQAAAQKATAEAKRVAEEAALEIKRTQFRAGGIIALAGGAALVAAGGVLGWRAEFLEQQAEGAPPGTIFDRTLETRGRAFGIAGIIADVVGGAAIGTGIGLLIWSAQHHAARTEKKRVWLMPRGTGFAVGGTF